ncbi:DNA-binding GntR family transcriptional regulator [Prauserella isguenensis]|uniref:DNA-binding GntR family transcriptional regulator n=1 Tax=Prauserella isguenensis TaxID=1470180 RepID=A0A839S563_9PSEU|nr:GntR family transcriptional regulator [Prauserella isguenensis]MBB3052433.1 DNA-binding GntR family transcriptional regulator [Prauserella isguenensis]
MSLLEELEEQIVLGLRYPRERLVEDELMRAFSAKRHVVRSALQELENRGLVERKPNVGAFVKAYTAQEVRDLYAVRELLEVHCARLIPVPVPDERLDELVAIQRRHDEGIDAGELREVTKANMEFHRALFGLSDNTVLVDAIRRHAQMAHAIRSVTVTSPEYLEQSRREHWAMIDALRGGDTDTLAETCRAHLLPSRDAYLSRLPSAD